MDQMKIYRVEQKNEEPVEVQIIRSSRRSMGLQVKADGTVCARVPMQVMDYAVQEFIEGHADWIFKKRKLVLSRDNRPDIVYLPEVTEESDRERRVLADGHDLAEKGVAAEVRRQVGLVFQYPENQLFANTVYDDVAFGPRNMGLGAEEVDRRVREGLALVGLSFDELSERSPFDLSGGQQRRVAFAGVLAMEPEVLVLDEPQ